VGKEELATILQLRSATTEGEGNLPDMNEANKVTKNKERKVAPGFNKNRS